MSCLTVFTLVEALIFLAGILSPGWVRIVQESLAYGTNSTNYGLFYYMKCTRDGCLANTFYEDSFNHSYQGDDLYPRYIAAEFNVGFAVILNFFAFITTKCATRRNRVNTTKNVLEYVLPLFLMTGSFFIMFTVIAEYVTIYLLAKKTIVTSSIDVFDPVHVVSNVKTPYSLIITTIAMLFKSSIIVHLMGKIRSLPEDSPVNNETLPPPYQSLSNVASTQNNPYTTNTTRRPGSRSTTPTPVYYGSSDATQPLLSEPREVFPNYHGNNTMERPLPNAPAHYNPFDERSDQP